MNIRDVKALIESKVMTKTDLCALAAGFVGLELSSTNQGVHLTSNLGKYEIAGDFLRALKNANFSLTHRLDGVTTLCDENTQNVVPGWVPSCIWNFVEKNGKKELELSLYASLEVDQSKRGIVLLPRVYGTYVSACDRLPQERVFNVVAKYSIFAHPIVIDIAIGKGSTTVHWHQIGLSGIRQIHRLFLEFGRDNPKFSYLRGSNISPFSFSKQDGMFLPEEFQPDLFSLWQEELKKFKTSL